MNDLQAQPLLRDKQKFTQIADPLLEGKYPTKGLYQALAVAAMCLQEDAAARPLIGDVVSAIEYLARQNDQEKPEEQATKTTISSSTHDECFREESASKEEQLSLAC